MKRATPFLTFGLGAALAAAFVWYYDVFTHWQPKPYPFAIIALALGIVALTLLTLWARGKRKALALVWKATLSVTVFLGVLLGGFGHHQQRDVWRPHPRAQDSCRRGIAPVCGAGGCAVYPAPTEG